MNASTLVIWDTSAIPPKRTAAIAAAVVDACAACDATGSHATPVSLKHRLGVDDHDSYEELEEFVRLVAETAGITQFVVHARKAWLKELSPTLNLEVPPVSYAGAERGNSAALRFLALFDG